jgi:hypothetical protein
MKQNKACNKNYNKFHFVSLSIGSLATGREREWQKGKHIKKKMKLQYHELCISSSIIHSNIFY